MAMTTGAGSPRVYEPLAEQLVAGLLLRRPELAAYPEELAAWARAEARAQLLDRYAAEHGLLTAEGDPRGFARLMGEVERAAARGRVSLGLTPLSEAQLAKERVAASVLAYDLSALAETGRAVLAKRSELEPSTRPDLAGEVLERIRIEGHEAVRRLEDESAGDLGV